MNNEQPLIPITTTDKVFDSIDLNKEFDSVEFINMCETLVKKGKKKKYKNIKFHFSEWNGHVSLQCYGERPLTKNEIKSRENVLVVCRMIDKTSEGLTREDILSNKKYK
jgi:hypothetical protein